MSVNNETLSRDILKIKALLLRLFFSTAGISAFLYVFGMLSVRAKMNMLGIWTGVDINSYNYLNESIRIFSSLPLILGCLMTSAVPVIIISYLAGVLGYSFAWNRSTYIPLKYCSLLLLFIAILTIVFAQPMANQNLLFGDNTQTNFFLPLVISCNAGTWAFYSAHILVSVFIFFLALRLWLTTHPQREDIYGYFKGITTVFFFINSILVPINYGVMISAKEYREATVLLTKQGIVNGNIIQGTLLLQTDNELVLFYKNLKKEEEGRLFIIRRENIGVIQIANPPVPLLVRIWNDNSKINQKEIHSANSEDTNFLFQLFPTLVEYLSSFGNETITILNNFQNTVKGNRDVEIVFDKSELNIWIYDLDREIFRQITSDGGYFSPRISPDGQRICFIKDSKLWEMSILGKKKILVDQQRLYARIIGWDGKFQYLVTDEDEKIYLLNKQQGSIQEIKLGTGKLKNISINAFIKISQATSNGKVICAARKEGNSWWILEDHDDYVNAKVILDDGCINRSPSWLNGEHGIIFVSNRKEKPNQVNVDTEKR